MVHHYEKQNPYVHPDYIRGVVLDNDNTLYAEPANAKEYHVRAATRAVQEQLPDFSDDQVLALLEKSKMKYGGSLDIFTKEFGADMAQLRTDQYHFLIEDTTDNGFFDPDKTPKGALSKLRIAGVNMTVATHGNEEWTKHSLDQVGIRHLFNDRSHVYKDSVNNIGKNVGPDMYDAALDSLAAPETDDPSQRGVGYAMVEDTMENLYFAKERGMMTVLINTGKYDPDFIEDYVDVVVSDQSEAIDAIWDSNSLNEHRMRNEYHYVTSVVPDDYADDFDNDGMYFD